MTKRELSISILEALVNVDHTKATKMADTNHGEFVSLMKHSKSHLEEMNTIAERVKKYPQGK